MSDEEFRRQYYTPEQWHDYRTNWNVDATPYSGHVETRNYRAPTYADEVARNYRYKRNAILRKKRMDAILAFDNSKAWAKRFLPTYRRGTFRSKMERWDEITTPLSNPKKWRYYKQDPAFEVWNNLTPAEQSKTLRLQKAKQNYLIWSRYNKKKIESTYVSRYLAKKKEIANRWKRYKYQ